MLFVREGWDPSSSARQSTSAALWAIWDAMDTGASSSSSAVVCRVVRGGMTLYLREGGDPSSRLALLSTSAALGAIRDAMNGDGVGSFFPAEMEVKEVEATEMVAEEEAVVMEDLSDCVVADPHPSFLSLVLHEEAVVGSIPIAVEAIGIIQDAKLPFEQQGNAGGSLNFFADQQKGCNNITSKRHSCHPPCLFGVSAEVPLDVTENVSDARDENVADTDDVPKSRAPPARKLGFKGKRDQNPTY